MVSNYQIYICCECVTVYYLFSLLGNELSGHGIGTRVESTQYANDVIKLKSIVDNIYGDSLSKPLVLSPGGFFDATWFKYLVEKTKPNSMDAITHHIYNLGPGTLLHIFAYFLGSGSDTTIPIPIPIQVSILISLARSLIPHFSTVRPKHSEISKKFS